MMLMEVSKEKIRYNFQGFFDKGRRYRLIIDGVYKTKITYKIGFGGSKTIVDKQHRKVARTLTKTRTNSHRASTMYLVGHLYCQNWQAKEVLSSIWTI